MKPKKKYNEPKLHEYRVKYNPGASHAMNDSYHYFQAQTAEQALLFHEETMKRKGLESQTVSVEEKDPYRSVAGVPPKWLDRSEVIHHEQ
jgi:hypothetical protein